MSNPKIIAVVGATGAQMAADLSKALGKDVAYNEVTPAVYRGRSSWPRAAWTPRAR